MDEKRTGETFPDEISRDGGKERQAKFRGKIGGVVKPPRLMYGTAWKEERTADLVGKALRAGFRAIDTANQRKHYFEEGVGNGLAQAMAEKVVSRDQLFLQTKFTFAGGQDHRKPYRQEDPVSAQVADSFKSSLAHLRTDYIDSLVLHGPYGYEGLESPDFEAWSAMEALVHGGKVSCLGISNVSASQLEDLCRQVSVRPLFVQNRCFARAGWDRDVRESCRRLGIHYQGFSLLTANVRELSTPFIFSLARKYEKTIPQIVFRFALQLQMIPLTGTTDPVHMSEDLHIFDFELTAEEVRRLETLAG